MDIIIRPILDTVMDTIVGDQIGDGGEITAGMIGLRVTTLGLDIHVAIIPFPSLIVGEVNPNLILKKEG